MVNRLWLFGLVLLIPLIGLAAFRGVQNDMNSHLRTALVETFPDADHAAIFRLTVDQVCQDPAIRLQMSAACGLNDLLNGMSSLSLAAVGSGLLLILIIWLAGTAARVNRSLLLRIFKPGLYLTLLAVSALILVNAAIAIAAVYFVESATSGSIHIQLLFLIGLSALAGVTALVRTMFSQVRIARTHVAGIALKRADVPNLWHHVEELAGQLGALEPEHVVLGLEPNFFVTEAEVVCLNGEHSGRTLYCSLPLSRILTTREFSAIIGHELGHFKGQDTAYSTRFYPIYRGTTAAIAQLRATSSWIMLIPRLPAMATLSYFLERFAVAELGIGRQRELAADQAGASVTDPETLATALVKVHAFSGLAETSMEAVVHGLREGTPVVNMSQSYAALVAEHAWPGRLEGILATHTPHPTDTHPSLGVRLDALGVTLDSVAHAALAVEVPDAAINLVDDPEAIEEQLSEAYQLILARQIGINVVKPVEPAARASHEAMRPQDEITIPSAG